MSKYLFKDNSDTMEKRYFNFSKTENFDIPTATTEEIKKIIKELDPKNTTGLEKIPPKIVKMSADVIDSHLPNIIMILQ